GEEALGGRPRYSEDEADEDSEDTVAEADDELPQTIADASIDLAAGARYRATGKRKTAVARVTLKPGTGEYIINGKSLEVFFPRHTLQRTIRQPLETVGYETRMDVVASMHGGGVSAQAGALRHGISRALLEADPNLRSELKRRGFLTRDARVKERKKAGGQGAPPGARFPRGGGGGGPPPPPPPALRHRRRPQRRGRVPHGRAGAGALARGGGARAPAGPPGARAGGPRHARVRRDAR